MISLCPAPKLSSVCSNGSSWAQLPCEAAGFKLVSFGRAAFVPLPLLCVCLHRPNPCLHLPAASRRDSHSWTSCCLWISPSLACFMEMLWPLLHFTASFKIPPLVFGNFKFLLISYSVAMQKFVMEVAEALAAHLSYSSILSLLHPWVSYFVSTNYFGNYLGELLYLFPSSKVELFMKWLSFQNVQCPRDLIANSQIPSLCPYIFGPLWEGLMIQPRFLRNSFVLSLAGHGAGKEILMCFSDEMLLVLWLQDTHIFCLKLPTLVLLCVLGARNIKKERGRTESQVVAQRGSSWFL